MVQFLENVIVISTSEALGEADGRFNVGLQGTFQHLIDFAVVVIVVPDAEHALNVIPNGCTEARRIDILLRAHKIVCQLVHQTELVVQQVAHVIVQAVDERKGVIVPRVVLHSKRRNQIHRAATSKVLKDLKTFSQVQVPSITSIIRNDDKPKRDKINKSK